jgi:hypothetical protein
MSAVIESQSFEERVYEKIRTDIGSLMTDDELKKLVEKSIDRMFFTEREIPGSRWDNATKKPPLIFEAVQAAVGAKINELVRQYVLDHADLYAKAIEEALGKGFFNIARSYFEASVNSAMQPSLWNIQESLKTALTPR